MYTLMKELGTNWVPKIEYAVRAKKKDEEAGKDKKIEEGKENKEVGEDKKDEEKEKWYKFEKVTQRRAVINDSLFLRFMKKRITRTKFDNCHDFIVLKFNYNVKYRVGKDEQSETKTANELRALFYKKGFEFSYDKTNKAGEVVDSTTVRYKMLMRSPGKAKNGECIFIRDSLYDTAIKYLTMGLFGEMQKKALKNPNAVFNIVGLSAYQTLTTATAYGYIHSVPDIASVNKALSVLLNELDIYPIITTKGARHTYGSYLWHKGFDLGVIAKILGHRDISMLVEVYGRTLEEKIFEEFNQIRDVWKDCS